MWKIYFLILSLQGGELVEYSNPCGCLQTASLSDNYAAGHSANESKRKGIQQLVCKHFLQSPTYCGMYHLGEGTQCFQAGRRSPVRTVWTSPANQRWGSCCGLSSRMANSYHVCGGIVNSTRKLFCISFNTSVKVSHSYKYVNKTFQVSDVKCNSSRKSACKLPTFTFLNTNS